jgi:adenylosuccinate lyase
MINKYHSPRVAKLWGSKHTYWNWIRVEGALAVAQGHNELSVELSKIALDYSFVDLARRQEDRSEHEVMGFLQALEVHLIDRGLALKHVRWLHYGMTSSDLTDTALALTIRDVSRVFNLQTSDLLDRMDASKLGGWRARMARTHGQEAMVTSHGHGVQVLHSELIRVVAHNRLASDRIPGKLSGPVGDNRLIDPGQEIRALKMLDMQPVESTQAVPRDRLVDWLQSVGALATWAQKLATWIRFGAIQGVDQFQMLPRSDEYAGSSAMPHKLNPTVWERICGLAVLVRANIRAVEETQVWWADHSLEHTSVERVVLPAVTEWVSYILQTVLTELDRVMPVGLSDADTTGYDSYQHLHQLVDKGMLRSQAYRMVQNHQTGEDEGTDG